MGPDDPKLDSSSGHSVPLTYHNERERTILTSQAYLNNHIINITLRLIQNEYPLMCFNNTYFMEFITNPNYLLSTKLRRLNFFSHDIPAKWYISVNHGYTHWLFLTLNLERKHIAQHDSLPNHKSTDYATLLCRIFEDANLGYWTSEQMIILSQHNSYDCGVYVLVNILICVSGIQRDIICIYNRKILSNAPNTSTLPDTLYTSDCPLPRRPTTPNRDNNNSSSQSIQSLNFWATSQNIPTMKYTPKPAVLQYITKKKKRERNFQVLGDIMAPT